MQQQPITFVYPTRGEKMWVFHGENLAFKGKECPERLLKESLETRCYTLIVSVDTANRTPENPTLAYFENSI